MCEHDGIHRLRRAALGAALLLVTSVSVAAGDDGELHDPLRPPGWGSAETAPARDTFNADAWQLESTLTSNGRRVAIVNGRTVRAGSRVGGARVLRIRPGAVRLDYRGREFTIRRPAARIRKRATGDG